MPANEKPPHITQEDWDSVDVPELSDEQMAEMRPAAEVAPEIVKAYRAAQKEKKKARD